MHDSRRYNIFLASPSSLKNTNVEATVEKIVNIMKIKAAKIHKSLILKVLELRIT